MRRFNVGLELLAIIQEYWRGIHTYLLVALSLNVLIAPLVYAATDEKVSQQNAYALGVLGLLTLSLSVYLFVVIFQPERF